MGKTHNKCMQTQTKMKPKSGLIWSAQFSVDYEVRLRLFPPWKENRGAGSREWKASHSSSLVPMEEKDRQLELESIPPGWRRSKDKKKWKQNKIKIPLRLGVEESIQGRRDSMTLHILGLSALVSYSVEHKLGRAAHNSILRVGLIIKYRSMLPAGCITNSSMQTIHCRSPE